MDKRIEMRVPFGTFILFSNVWHPSTNIGMKASDQKMNNERFGFDCSRHSLSQDQLKNIDSWHPTFEYDL